MMSFPSLSPITKRQVAAKQARKGRRRGVHGGPEVESLEQRCLLSAVRTITGFDNNLEQPAFGQAGTDLIRISPAAYADGVSAPSGVGRPNARAVSNALNDQTDPANPSQDLSSVQSQHLSDFAYVWGQFIDHDMDLTPDNSGQAFNIPPGSPGDPMGTEPFTRSQFDPNTGKIVNGVKIPRQQVNVNTSFLDLSQVYGSTDVVADALRTHSGGQLKTSPGNLLPFNNTTYFTPAQLAALNMANDAHVVPDSQLFAAGDRRANENIELTALQTLFVRNHNLIAKQLQALHPTWSDEQLYQEARKINIAEEELITYTEFLSAILGPNPLRPYTGYKDDLNPSIATEFSTVGFRFGHSLLSNSIGRDLNDGTGIADASPDGSSILLRQDFFTPELIQPAGVNFVDPITGHTASDIGAIVKADADAQANENDLLAVRDVRNLLFGPTGAGGTDLMARDVQRARDHGIADYNSLRAAYGLPKVTSFAQITSNVLVQEELKQVYGNVNNIDVFEGMLAEDHVQGTDVGPLLKAILTDQFTRLRDGDRFFFLNEHFTNEEAELIQQGNSLAKVIEANTPITNLQDNVFVFKASIEGKVFFDNGNGGGGRGLAGFTVNLLDDTGAVIATTTTDAKGHYIFTDQTGIPGTGRFTVSLVLANNGLKQTTPNPGTIAITRGDIDVDGTDFGVRLKDLSGGATSAFAVMQAAKAAHAV